MSKKIILMFYLGFISVTAPTMVVSATLNNESAYSQSKVQSLNRGTENTDESQTSFFVIPAIVIGLSLTFLFLNKK